MSKGEIKAKVTLIEARKFLRGWLELNDISDSQLPNEELYAYLGRNMVEGTKEDAGAFRTDLEVAMAIPESKFAMMMLEFVESLFDVRELNGFESECKSQLLGMIGSQEARDFDLLTFVVSASLKLSLKVDEQLLFWSSQVLDGSVSRPTRSGPKLSTTVFRDYRLSRLSLIVSKGCELQLYTNNELSEKPTAAEVVSEELGVSLEIVKNAIKKFSKLGVARSKILD